MSPSDFEDQARYTWRVAPPAPPDDPTTTFRLGYNTCSNQCEDDQCLILKFKEFQIDPSVDVMKVYQVYEPPQSPANIVLTHIPSHTYIHPHKHTHPCHISYHHYHCQGGECEGPMLWQSGFRRLPINSVPQQIFVNTSEACVVLYSGPGSSYERSRANNELIRSFNLTYIPLIACNLFPKYKEPTVFNESKVYVSSEPADQYALVPYEAQTKYTWKIRPPSVPRDRSEAYRLGYRYCTTGNSLIFNLINL